VKRRDFICTLPALALASSNVRAAEGMHAYVDPTQRELPWPYFSFARQPWRSYLETMPASRYLDGLGVVWSGLPPSVNEDAAAGALATAGFRRVRVELPWSAMRWDEMGIVDAYRATTLRTLRAFAKQGLRPLVLLNAHHAAPCPTLQTEWLLKRDAPAGSRELTFAGRVTDISVGDSMIATLADGAHAGPLVVDVVTGQQRVVLSKPTTRNLAAGTTVNVAQLKYLPLYPPGRPELERTLDGWVRYVRYTIGLVAATCGREFDVEIWNELTFGSDFLDIDRYHEKPLFPRRDADFLHQGGAAWELAQRTVDELRTLAPEARAVWGFSNTTFFHTAVKDLPPGTAGQSYHPYGVGARCFGNALESRASNLADQFVPSGCATMPEGWAHTFQQTESLIRLLNPRARMEHPARSEHFEHFLTEHGSAPNELGIREPSAAWRAKQKFVLRAPVFWLNKGIAGVFVFNAWTSDPASFGMLTPAATASPATEALRRMVARFAGATVTDVTRQLNVTLARVGGDIGVYPNDPNGLRVPQRDVVAVLPYQTRPNKFLVAVYVMTEDYPRDLEPQLYRMALRPIAASAQVELYDPLLDRHVLVERFGGAENSLELQFALTDSPRLLEVTEA
jgi:hypothetical protein